MTAQNLRRVLVRMRDQGYRVEFLTVSQVALYSSKNGNKLNSGFIKGMK